MSFKKNRIALSLALATAFSGLGAVGISLQAAAAGCSLSASTYYSSAAGNIHGVAYRSGCGNARNVTSALYHEMPWFLPDARIASATRKITNGSVTSVAHANRGWNYYTQASDSAGASARSSIYAH
ncbi:hypothetical protein [Trueperella pyogenes]